MLGQTRTGGSLSAATTSRAARFEEAPLQLVLADPRSDDKLRVVTIADGRVGISRRVAGIAMRVSVPLASYRGVAVRIDEIDDGALAVVLEHPDPALSLTLERHAEADPLVAGWRRWAATLNCPLLSPAVPGAGAARVKVSGPPRRRRRHGTVAQRRPRFLARRKAGVSGAAPAVHAGEREIIARN